jgi:glycosyltransferase involved in cell wall biosynthesis
MFIEQNETELNKSMHKIISDTKLSKSMSKYSAKYAHDNFSWDNNIKKLLAIYKGLLK